ncbi:MAG: hypothetical protein ABGX16_00010 [Pirellulales bacterium]
MFMSNEMGRELEPDFTLHSTTQYTHLVRPPKNSLEEKIITNVTRRKRDHPTDSDALPSSVQSAIDRTLPKTSTGIGCGLFKFVRALKAIPDLGDLSGYGDHWHNALRIYDRWPIEQTRRLYMQTLEKVRTGEDKRAPAIAFEMASRKPYPAASKGMSEPLRILAGTCRELQLMAGDNPFFIGCREVGELFDVHFTSGATYLKILIEYDILQKVTPGRKAGRRATTYLYLPDPNEAKR